MTSTQYDAYKYCIQDTNCVYVGARFTYREIMESREVNFKFKAIVEHYLLREEIPETSLESELYYLKPDSFTYRTLEQLHARVKINRLVVKKSLFHKQQQVYQETVLKLLQKHGGSRLSEVPPERYAALFADAQEAAHAE